MEALRVVTMSLVDQNLLAVVAIDRVGLEMAARSFERKRQKKNKS